MATETREQTYNWDGLNARTATTLKAPTVHEVPDPIVALAQRSYDGIEEDGETKHVLSVKLPSEAQAEAFVKHLRNAGAHVKPNQASISVAIDPDGTGDKRTVRFRAGEKRGRRSV